jgi:hypothetical protein
MSDSTTWLDTLSASDSQKEITNNELFDAASPATLFGRHASASSALTWGYYGGRFWNGSAAVLINNGTLSLTNAATNYIEATTAGVVSSNTSGFTAGRIRIAKVVTAGGAVTSYEDHRAFDFGSAGLAGAQPYDVGGSYSAAPTASLVVIRYPFPRAVSFPASMTSSKGVAGTAATAQTDFDLQKNGSSFGTMRFAAAATTATFIAASSTSFAAGDILTVVAPASPDATLAGIGFSLAGTR